MSTAEFEPFHLELYPETLFQRLREEELFDGSNAPLEIDLGCGDGRFLQSMAEKFPQRNFLGVERLLGRVRKVCRRSDRAGLGNIRALRLETTYAVEWLLPKGSAERVHLLFPDPWPKKKHHKRRLMAQPKFLKSVADLLKEGGEFLFKTDHEEYFEVAKEAVEECPCFEVLDWPEDAFYYAETDFERQWKEAGRHIQGLRLLKVSD
ncbi:MAG: tRNA (guanosine(46)-N7)-methyltransferase TrmB [Verrucomicrobia bacterium]|nr:tRNA (guanosine(46)-N7)-methyltransferase TrmB [Verrucomicrobiota bacterium]